MASFALPGLIAVHGRKRAGKGTIADHLVAAYGYEVVSFADPLKDVLRPLLAHLGLSPAQVVGCLTGDLKEVPLGTLGAVAAKDSTTRQLMQKVGDDLRAIDPGLVVSIALHRIREARAAGRRVVVDDLRMPAELDALADAGAVLWLVTSNRVQAQAADAHSTERGLPPERFDAAFANDGSFESLYARIGGELATVVI